MGETLKRGVNSMAHPTIGQPRQPCEASGLNSTPAPRRKQSGGLVCEAYRKLGRGVGFGGVKIVPALRRLQPALTEAEAASQKACQWGNWGPAGGLFARFGLPRQGTGATESPRRGCLAADGQALWPLSAVEVLAPRSSGIP